MKPVSFSLLFSYRKLLHIPGIADAKPSMIPEGPALDSRPALIGGNGKTGYQVLSVMQDDRPNLGGKQGLNTAENTFVASLTQ